MSGGRVCVIGASGTIGGALCQELRRRGHSVVAVGRSPARGRERNPDYEWRSLQELGTAFRGCHAVYNLSGAPIIGKPFAKPDPAEHYASRVGVTQAVLAALSTAEDRPGVLINASAIGFYDSLTIDGTELTENSPAGSDSLAQLTVAWEAAARPVQSLGVRLVLARTGILLSSAPSGALAQFLRPFQAHLGGTVGMPNSWRSWIHMEDEIGLLIYAMEQPAISGPLNLTAPNPVPNRQFVETVATLLGRRSWLPVPEYMVKLAFGGTAYAITRGRRILPRKALEAGYVFKYPFLQDALTDLLKP